jgi:hypothetical protein
MSEIKINSQGEVKLFDSDNSNYIGLKAPGTVSSDQTFILPDADGSANNALKTDGSGNLGFVDVTTLVTQGIDWQSTLKTGDFTAASGEGYFINTTSGAITATLPASPSAGAIVAFKDYAATFATNNLTIGRNSSNIQGGAVDSVLSTNRASVVLVYVDATKGWLYVQESNVQNLAPPYVAATGGTITTSGDFKIHTFTSSGTFTVTNAGNASGSNSVDYLVVAGGASGGGYDNYAASGGGAGGMRYSFPNPATGGLAVTAQAYPVTVGAGGTHPLNQHYAGGNGANSVFSSITSTGGGGGGGYTNIGPPDNFPNYIAKDGGSGGGAAVPQTFGSTNSDIGDGNTPPVSPSQGNNGGNSTGNPVFLGGGGGGHNAVGANAPPSAGTAGAGGAGTALSITGSPVTYAGGGGGGANAGTVGSGGAGGGGAGGGTASNIQATAGTANTGGAGGGGGNNPTPTSLGGAGGSGIVVIRYKYQN